MGTIKHLDFDYYLNCIKSEGKDHLLRILAKEIMPHSSVSAALMEDLIDKRAMNGGISVENGITIFDMTTRFVERTVTVIATLEDGMDLQSSDNKPVDLFIGVLSPSNNVSAHLQHLSAVARLFRSKELCKVLRGTRSVDEMKVLFMPTQDWMVAA